MGRLALLAAGLGAGRAGFSARYLWVQQCEESAFQETMHTALADGFRSSDLAFTGVFCPWTYDDLVASVEMVIAASATATSSNPVLNVIYARPHWWWPFLETMRAGTRYVHLWMEAAPQLPNVTGLSLTFAPDNYLGGWLSGREFCIREAASRPHVIAYLGAGPEWPSSTERLRGFAVAVAHLCPQHHNVHSSSFARWSRAEAQMIASGLFFRDAAISTFVCANDNMALGVIDAANALRPQGTGGLRVIGYDDIPEIRRWIAEGTVVVSMNQVQPTLVSAVVGMVHHLEDMLASSDAKELTGEYVAARLGLNKSDMTIPSLPAPRVSDMEQFIMRETLNGYRSESRPFSGHNVLRGGTPVKECLAPNVTLVEVQFEVKTLELENNRLLITGLHRLWWDDPRLRFDFRVPGGTECMQPIIAEEERLWKPDIYFDSALKSDDIFDSSGERLIQFDSSGHVTWVRRARLTLSCTMDFTMMPFDTQRCIFSQGLFRHNADRVRVQWRAGGRGFRGWEKGELTGSEFELADVTETAVLGGSLLGDSGQWSFVHATLVLKRKSRYYIKYVVLPMFCFILIAWSSFFIACSAAPARVALTVICFLALNRYVDSTLLQLPKDAGDVWLINILLASQYFVLYSIIEYAMVNLMMREEAQGYAAKKAAMDKFRMVRRQSGLQGKYCDVLGSTVLGRVESLEAADLDPAAAAAERREFILEVKKKSGLIGKHLVDKNGDMRLRSQHLDIFSRIAFPLVYVIVMIGFFVWVD